MASPRTADSSRVAKIYAVKPSAERTRSSSSSCSSPCVRTKSTACVVADDAHDLEEEIATRALTPREWAALLAAAHATRAGDAVTLAPLRNDEVRITHSQLRALAATALAADAVDVAAALPPLPAAMLHVRENAVR